MRLTIERLRAVVLAGAALLLASLTGLLFLEHRRAHQVLHDLPSQLGIDIQKQTDGITYSQSLGGRIIFTLHAAKGTQLKNGEAQLENAGLVLYGEGNGRADRIYGKSFHYDQKTGTVHALGVVDLDLQAPAPVSAAERLSFASGLPLRTVKPMKGAAEPIHVITSDLFYAQKTGIATTDAPLRFVFDGMNGSARGATYNSRTGYTTLSSQVDVHGEQDGRAYHLLAESAALDRENNRLHLHAAELESGSDGASGGRVRAADMVVLLRAAGGVERIDGAGGVELSDGENTARSPTAELALAAGNRPQLLQMHGGVAFTRSPDAASGERAQGRSGEAVGRFDTHGVLSVVELRHDVHFTSDAAKPGAQRQLAGDTMSLEFTGGGAAGRRWVHKITTEGNGRLEQTAIGAQPSRSSLAADRVVAQLKLDDAGRAQLDTAQADGNAHLRQTTAKFEESSEAPSIEAHFRAAIAQAGATATGSQLLSATERGGVVVDRTIPGENGAAPLTVHATAREASYDGVTRRDTLSGDASVSEPGRSLRAERIVLTEQTGSAEAIGSVQATLRQVSPAGTPAPAAPPEPVHAVGARATLDHAAGLMTIFGSTSSEARLWKGASQVEAPMIELNQNAGTLDAHGSSGAPAAAAVHTVLAQESAGGRSSVLRVESGTLHYSDKDRRAEFLGAVVLRSEDGVLHAPRAIALLTPATAKVDAQATATSTGRLGLLSGGAIERITADGGVLLQQPGRTATGEQIVYTAATQTFVLTGTPAAPPRVIDQTTGSVTGAVLRFHTGDNSVTVEGAAAPAKSGRVHTETRLKQ